LCGKPLLQWVIEGAKTSELVSELFVATDHPEIAGLSESLGVRAVMTSEDCQTGTDRIYQTVQVLKKENKNFDVILNIQGDEPLISKKMIDPLAMAFLENANLEMATMAHPLAKDDLTNMNAVKVILNQNSEAIYFSRWPIPFSRKEYSVAAASNIVQKHIGIYGFKTAFLQKFCTTPQAQIEKAESLEQLRALHLGTKIKVISVSEPLLGIDTPEDLIEFEKRLSAK
jgi:3-deoxy-manno-octulosonate cytidylyltransferase (CMP-KDO synthetase)